MSGRMAMVALLAGAIALPLLTTGNPYLGFIVAMTLLYVLWAQGMNLLAGYSGLMPLMYAGIAGISAYLTVGLVMRGGWSFWAAMPLGVVGAALVGMLLGLPSLRLQGFYFTLSSLVIQTVITLVFTSFPVLTNGDTGINRIPSPTIPFSGGAPLQGMPFLLLLGVLAWVSVASLRALTRSTFGRRLVALREDAGLAEALGIDVTRSKLLAFFIASLYAGVGGAFYAVTLQFISPRSFDLLTSLNIWLMVAFGGRGTLAGPLIGALILAPVPYLLQQFYSLKDVVYGALIIVVAVLMPAGVYGEIAKRTLRPGVPATRTRQA